MNSSLNNQLTKALVRVNFNKAKSTYDLHCHIQTNIARYLIKRLASIQRCFPVAVDVACGTGVSSSMCLSYLNIDKLFAMDLSDELISVAKTKLQSSKVEFVVADFESPVFRAGSFDLITASMGLQWAFSLSDSLRNFNDYLSAGGVLAFAIPIFGSFHEVPEQMRNNTLAPSMISTMIQNIGFKVIDYSEQTWVDRFDSPAQLLRSFKHLGANTLLYQQPSRHGLSRRQQLAEFIASNDVTLTYNIGFFILGKSSK